MIHSRIKAPKPKTARQIKQEMEDRAYESFGRIVRQRFRDPAVRERFKQWAVDTIVADVVRKLREDAKLKNSVNEAISAAGRMPVSPRSIASTSSGTPLSTTAFARSEGEEKTARGRKNRR